MGEVWRARATTIDRVVALKMLLPQYAQDPDFDERFRREARAAARLDEPHVVPIHDVGEIDGRLYVTMRLIDGVNLDTLLRTAPLEPERAVDAIEQIASALRSAHRAGLVHRDVKPSNILLADNDFAYLIDFGIARAANDTALTSEGSTPRPHRRATLPRHDPRAGRGGPHGRSAPQSLRNKQHRSARIGPGDRNGSGREDHRPIPHRYRNGRRRTTGHTEPTKRHQPRLPSVGRLQRHLQGGLWAGDRSRRQTGPECAGDDEQLGGPLGVRCQRLRSDGGDFENQLERTGD
jgi:serine/threonine protein kinase